MHGTNIQHSTFNIPVPHPQSSVLSPQSSVLSPQHYNPLVPTFFEALNDLMASDTPLVTVTVVDTAGSVPQDRGAKMIVTRKGLAFGTVGGGKVETKAIAEAQRMLDGEVAENTRFEQWNLNKDVGMTCGGIVKLYFESHNV